MNAQSMGEALRAWHEFYALLGTASATMVGLLFVAVSVSSGVFDMSRRAALRVFLSASVVNFSLILASCLMVLAPLPNWLWLGGMILACGLFGLAHSCLAWRDTLHDGLIAKIGLEDRTWYIAFPLFGYLCLSVSGIAIACGFTAGCIGLASSMGLLLAVGVHNAWDITVWIISRRQ